MRYRALSIAFIIGMSSVVAQPPTTTLLPSVYYTSGSYSTGASTYSISGYASIIFHGIDYFVAGYDKMQITSPTWIYDQHFFVAGGLKNLYPFYLKLNYGRIEGTFDLSTASYSYDDHTDIVNGSLLYNVDLFFIGATYTYTTLRGYKNVQSHQIGLTGEWIIDPTLSLSINPLYTSLTDGRSFTSLAAMVTYSPWQPLRLQVSGMVGKRAYYFNPDLLTIFNQDETQENLWSLRAEYTLGKFVTLIGNYQATEFSGYSLRYATVGVRAHVDW